LNAEIASAEDGAFSHLRNKVKVYIHYNFGFQASLWSLAKNGSMEVIKKSEDVYKSDKTKSVEV
jgi:hypothetical protein